jgi:hypothetical protein
MLISGFREITRFQYLNGFESQWVSAIVLDAHPSRRGLNLSDGGKGLRLEVFSAAGQSISRDHLVPKAVKWTQSKSAEKYVWRRL